MNNYLWKHWFTLPRDCNFCPTWDVLVFTFQQRFPDPITDQTVSKATFAWLRMIVVYVNFAFFLFEQKQSSSLPEKKQQQQIFQSIISFAICRRLMNRKNLMSPDVTRCSENNSSPRTGPRSSLVNKGQTFQMRKCPRRLKSFRSMGENSHQLWSQRFRLIITLCESFPPTFP